MTSRRAFLAAIAGAAVAPALPQLPVCDPLGQVTRFMEWQAFKIYRDAYLDGILYGRGPLAQRRTHPYYGPSFAEALERIP